MRKMIFSTLRSGVAIGMLASLSSAHAQDLKTENYVCVTTTALIQRMKDANTFNWTNAPSSFEFTVFPCSVDADGTFCDDKPMMVMMSDADGELIDLFLTNVHKARAAGSATEASAISFNDPVTQVTRILFAKTGDGDEATFTMQADCYKK